MTRQSYLQVARCHAGQYLAAVISAGLMYWGLGLIINMASYPVADGILRLINAAVQAGLRDVPPLPNAFSRIPWAYEASFAAAGTIVLAVGVLVGLWANVRKEELATR